MIMIQLSNPVARLNLAIFFEKLEAQYMQLRKKHKMKTSSVTQDIGLYYKSSPSMATQSPKIQIAFCIYNIGVAYVRN